LKTLQREHAELQATHATMQAQHEAVVKESGKMLAELTGRISEEAKAHMVTDKRLRARVAELEGELRLSRQAHEDLQRTLVEHKKKAEKMAPTAEAVELREKLAKQTRLRVDLQRALADSRDETKKLKHQLDAQPDIRAKNEALKADNARLAKRAAEKSDHALAEKLKDCETRNLVLERQNERFKSGERKAQARADQLKRELDESRHSSRDKLQQEVNSLRDRERSRRSELDLACAQVRAKEQEVFARDGLISRLQAQLQQVLAERQAHIDAAQHQRQEEERARVQVVFFCRDIGIQHRKKYRLFFLCARLGSRLWQALSWQALLQRLQSERMQNCTNQIECFNCCLAVFF
jgi:hypothetical protein